jgi:hypothetical protein
MNLKAFSIPQEITSVFIFKIAATVMAIFPVFLLVPLLVQNAINLPFMDQWDTPVNALLKIADRTFSFSDLIAQANESRPLFPRLLFLGVAFLTNWDIRYEYVVIFLVACLISYQIYRLSWLTIRGSEYRRLFLILLANLLIFSPVQSDNWLWGIQVITFIPIACITAGLVASYASFEIKLKTLILMGLCTVSTYSYANGMLSWFIVFPSAIFISQTAQNRNPKTQLWLIVGGGVGCLSNLVVYFHNYFRPSLSPSFSEALAHPLVAFNFFLLFLGSPLNSRGIELEPAQTIGLVLLLLFSCVLFYLLWHRKDGSLLRDSVPWVAIGVYACASGLITAAGRVGFGLETALVSRYTTFSLYLVVSLVYLLAIVADSIIQTHAIQETKKARIVRDVLVFLIASLVVLHAPVYLSHAKIISQSYRYRLYAKACVLFINFVDEKPTIEAVLYPSYNLVKPKINRLSQIHLLKPTLVESSDVSLLEEKQKSSSSDSYGFLDSIIPINEAEILISGWAIFPDRRQPADAVVLAYETPNSQPKAFAIAPVIDKSPDVAEKFKNEGYQNVRWSKTLALNQLPKGDIKVSAWAFDTETKRVFRLEGFKHLS